MLFLAGGTMALMVTALDKGQLVQVLVLTAVIVLCSLSPGIFILISKQFALHQEHKAKT